MVWKEEGMETRGRRSGDRRKKELAWEEVGMGMGAKRQASARYPQVL